MHGMQVHDLHRCTFGPGSAADGPRASAEAAAAWGRLQAGQDAMELTKMAGGGNALGISEPRRSHVRD